MLGEGEAVEELLLGTAERSRVPEPEVSGPREVRGLLPLSPSYLVHRFVQELDHVEAIEGDVGFREVVPEPLPVGG